MFFHEILEGQTFFMHGELHIKVHVGENSRFAPDVNAICVDLGCGTVVSETQRVTPAKAVRNETTGEILFTAGTGTGPIGTPAPYNDCGGLWS
jgi:hypothetical protein